MEIQEFSPILVSYDSTAESSLLPTDFSVYVRDTTEINHPLLGFEERILPTFNLYTGIDGRHIQNFWLGIAEETSGQIHSSSLDKIL